MNSTVMMMNMVLIFQLAVTGAGFTSGATLKCIYVDDSDDSETEGSMVTWTSVESIVCAADLDAGRFNMSLMSLWTKSQFSLRVYSDSVRGYIFLHEF